MSFVVNQGPFDFGDTVYVIYKAALFEAEYKGSKTIEHKRVHEVNIPQLSDKTLDSVSMDYLFGSKEEAFEEHPQLVDKT